MKKKLSVGIIGYGKVGKSLTGAFNSIDVLSAILTHSQENVIEIKNKHNDKISIYSKISEMGICPDYLFLTVPDNAITSVSGEIASHFKEELNTKYIIHTSGINSTDVLADCEKYGAKTAAAHPYQTFFFPSSSILFDIPWGIYTDYYKEIAGLIKLIRGNPVNLKEIEGFDRSLYHASAVIASNYLNSVIQLAGLVAQKAGISAAEFLSKIIQTTIDNNLNSMQDGIGFPLTGPIARADTVTLKLHIESLKGNETLLKSYCYNGLALAGTAFEFELIDNYEYEEIVKLFNDSINIFLILK